MKLEDIRPRIQPLLLDEAVQHNETYWTLCHEPQDGLLKLYEILKQRGAFLIKVFCEDARKDTGVFYVNYVFSLSPSDEFLFLKIAVPPEPGHFPSITPIFHGANWPERELQDQFGLKPLEHPNPRRWAAHGNWPADVYPMRKEFSLNAEAPWKENDFELRQVEGEGVFEIPVGPVHAGVIEPGHFRFSVAGEPIINLQARLYYTHKGIEKRAEGLPLERVLFFAESVSGDAAFAHATAFCHAVERLCGCQPPARAVALRTLLLEMERVYNHIADIGALANDVAFAVGYARAMVIRERMLQLQERWTGNRLLRGVAALGGVRVDLDDMLIKDIEQTISKVKREFDALWRYLLDAASVMDRFENTGYLSPESAKDLGILGLAGRASGIRRDSRKDHPHAAYASMPFELPFYETGDVLARACVRVEEIAQSIAIIQKILATLPSGPIRTSLPVLPACAFALGYTETWRGEAYHWVKTDAQGRIERYKITDPSTHNWPAMLFAIQDNVVADFPVINKSFNLSYSGNDR